ncbi:HET-domain-containing protein [Aspergillus sclerotioniger CBS 115572]|uniref:HET-domain-containing protein n=1 Tax=Aspergillus sclerotioniger CBS 115572 TaxID=1450535 RepID=A0A317V8L3_9EURO|nr:HET-domain-containing protein [Aspergillus sclerotioniger CBS 115572]PWY69641.1 HET-domain-containing protein [Aspergillus sclerotioniger CBS 115572]
MRLLYTTQSSNNCFDILEFADNNIPPYAILSHTWENEEVTLQDMQGGCAERKSGFKKVQDCCSVAKASGYDYAWIDTCCIDKTSSAELSEAINSMYRWYYEADVCYVYLADIQSGSEFVGSRWFTRGWTLQELIAPPNMIFFDGQWKEIGTKESLHHALSECTGIPGNILLGEDLETASVAQRMSWAAKRQTTRLEDRAYSLLGIFGINMPLIYGEGKRSFIRLQEEILKVIDDHSIFAWTSVDEEESHGGLLATSPAAFQKCANLVAHNPFVTFGNEPLIISSKGIHLGFNFVGLSQAGLGLAILHCTEHGKKESLIAIHLQDTSLTMQSFQRICCEKTELLDMTKFRPALCPVKRICVQQRRLAAHRSTASIAHTGAPGCFREEEFAELLSTTLEINKDVARIPGDLLSSAAQRDDLDLGERHYHMLQRTEASPS